MLCPICSRKMNNVKHFEKEREYQYNECYNCKFTTHPKRIHFDEVDKNKNNVNVKTNQNYRKIKLKKEN